MRSEGSATAPFSLGLLIAIGALSGCHSTVQDNLPERQADEIVLALDGAGIAARKERENGADRFRVEVASADSVRALAVLRQQGLPRPPARGLSELTSSSGLVPSANEERARLAQAIGGELEQTLGRLPGVTRARVHIALPVRAQLDESNDASASVWIEHHRDHPVAQEDVRALVAGAVTNLEPERISVVQTPAPPLPDPASLPRALEWVGPFAVAHGSATALRTTLIIAALINLSLVSLVVWGRISRRRRDRPTPPNGDST